MTRACRRCGHERDAHEHYTASTWCSACTDCPRFRWVAWPRFPWPWRRRTRAEPPSVAGGAEAWLAARETGSEDAAREDGEVA